MTKLGSLARVHSLGGAVAATKPTTPDAGRRALSWIGAVIVGAILITWQPWHALIAQQEQINSLKSQIATLVAQQKALDQQSASLKDSEAITGLARKQYQLVRVGQQLIQVVPRTKGGLADIDAADPANDPLVAPADAITVNPHGRGLTGETSSFWSRLATTLEFWR